MDRPRHRPLGGSRRWPERRPSASARRRSTVQPRHPSSPTRLPVATAIQSRAPMPARRDMGRQEVPQAARWSIRPTRILWLAVLGTQALANLIVVPGFLMTPPSGMGRPRVGVRAGVIRRDRSRDAARVPDPLPGHRTGVVSADVHGAENGPQPIYRSGDALCVTPSVTPAGRWPSAVPGAGARAERRTTECMLSRRPRSGRGFRAPVRLRAGGCTWPPAPPAQGPRS